MQIRCGRIGCVALTGTLLSLAPAPGLAQAPQENGLLGIRLMSTFQDVLRKFKQPAEIQIGQPTIPAQANAPGAQGQNFGPNMGPRGGMPGFPGMGGPPGYGGPPRGMGGPPFGAGGPGGYPGMGRRGMQGGYPGMGGRGMGGPPGYGGPGGYPGMSGAPFGGGAPTGLPGFSGGNGSRPANIPGMSGNPFGAGGYPGMSGAPFGAGGYPGNVPGAGNQAMEEEGMGEVTWWYHPQPNLYYAFLFNKDGRVIQIQEYGLKGTYRTRGGVGLGSSMSQIIHNYGWSTNGSPNGENVVLKYGSRHQVAFQLVKNKVVGITVGVVR